jgi:holin-like protein
MMIDFLRGFGIVVGFFLLGSGLHRVGIPIPGGVLGLLSFYLAMSAGLVKLQWVEKVAGLLLRHMVLLFVPLTVGLMEMGQVLSRQALAITASLLVSLAAVLLTTGLLGKWLLPTEPILPGLPLPGDGVAVQGPSGNDNVPAEAGR